MEKKEQNQIILNEKSIEVLVAKLIPTSQYFERSFEMIQQQLKDQREDIKEFKRDVDRRFEQVYDTINDFKHDVKKRFEQVDKNINDFKEDVDKRFEQVNDSIINLTFKIEALTKAQEVTIRDYIIERDRHYEGLLEIPCQSR